MLLKALNRRYSFRSTLCLKYTLEEIAVAAIYLATLRLSIAPVADKASETAWFESLRANVSDDALNSNHRRKSDTV